MFASHPTEIGPYRVLEVLGQGGVGTVYLVQQREPFRRKAALKLVKLGMDTREVLVQVCEGIRDDVANAHLSFEEAIAHDQTRDVERDTLAPLRRSIERVATALEEDALAPEQAAARAPEVEGQLAELRGELERLVAGTHERWLARDAEGRIGGELDQRYDENYLRILSLCSRIQGDLERQGTGDWKRAAQSAIAVNVVAVLGLLVGFGIAARFWTRRV